MNNRGFTLIELSAVLVIMGVLAAASVLSLIPTAKEHEFDAICKEIEFADSQVRSAARQTGTPQILAIDLRRNVIFWQQEKDNATAALVDLPESWELKVRLPSETVSSGRVEIHYAPDGYSQSYAICLPKTNKSRWIVVAGLSGQVYWTDDEEQLQSIFKLLAPPHLSPISGDDAH